MTEPVSRDEELAALIVSQGKDAEWGHRIGPTRVPTNTRPVSFDYALENGDTAGDSFGAEDRDLVSLFGGVEGGTRHIRHHHKWTRREIVSAIRAWHREHGEPPSYADWKKPNGRGIPSSATIARQFGSWSAAIEAAGFESRPRGGTAQPVQHTRLRPRIRKQKHTAYLTPAQIAAAYVLYGRHNLSMPELADRLWRSYGYRSPLACRTALLRAFHAEGFPVRSKVEALRLWHAKKAAA